jgi:hypothetical protein
MTLSNCRQEINLGERKPDIYAQFDGSPIAVELAFTHICDDAKIDWFRRQDLTAIEIDIFPPDDLTAEDSLSFLEKRLFDASNGAHWLHHSREAQAVADLDEIERSLRASKKRVEAAFLRAETKERQSQERRNAFKLQIKELEAKSYRIGNLTLRLAYSELRATLTPKVMRYSRMHDEHWSELLKINELVGGQWNSRFEFFEFRRASSAEAHIAYLELQSIVAAWVAGPPPDEPHPPVKPQQSVARRFASADDQELFEELAGIKEFDGHLSREEAEREAYCEVMQLQAERQLRRLK